MVFHHKNAQHLRMDKIMTKPTDKKPDHSRDTSDSTEPVFRLYDPMGGPI